MTHEPLHGLPLDVATRIDEVCSRFESAWRAGPPPRIEDFLAEVPAEQSGSLLRELLPIECDYRRKRGEAVALSEYLARFPQHADAVRAALPELETQTGDSHGRTLDSREASGSSATLPAPAPNHRTVLGQYDLLEKLGEGGMGAVFKARHTRLDKLVAIKLLPAERTANAQNVARFNREMKAVGRLEHPHIVRALDANEDHGTHYLVMEYVAGTDLSQLVAQHGPLPIAEACELVRQAALGLQYAHENGLVHRDIKPSNLMLSRSGSSSASGAPSASVKILDLGLALLQDADPTAGRELTGTGQVMGTIEYMAPEQTGDAHLVDARADLYSLGGTLYKLLTGRTPFGGDRYPTLIAKMIALGTESPEPVTRLRPSVPAALATLIERLMAKRPDQRPSSAGEVAALLQPFAAGANLALLFAPSLPRSAVPVIDPTIQPGSLTSAQAASQVSLEPIIEPTLDVAAMPASFASLDVPTQSAVNVRDVPAVPPRRRRMKLVFAAGLAAVLLFGIYLIVRDKDGKQVVKLPLPPDHSIEVQENKPEVPAAPLESQPEPSAPSPATETPNYPNVPPGPLDALDPKNIHPVHLEPGLPRELVGVLGDKRWRHWRPVTSVAFSPDGKLVASGDESGLIKVWDVATKLPVGFLKGHASAVRSLAFTPDSQTLASAGDKVEPICLWKMADAIRRSGLQARPEGVEERVGEPSYDTTTRIILPRFPVIQLRFTADGESLIGLVRPAENKLAVSRWSLATRTEQHHYDVPLAQAVLSPLGNLLAGHDAATVDVKLWDAPNGAELPLPSTWQVKGTVRAISTNGKLLVTAQPSRIDIWKATTGELFSTCQVENPAFATFSPDGRRLAAAGRAIRVWDVAKANELGAFRARLSNADFTSPVAFSHDGTWMSAGLHGDVVLVSASDFSDASIVSSPPGNTPATQEERNVQGMAIEDIDFAPNRAEVVAGSHDGRIVIWNLAAHRPVFATPPVDRHVGRGVSYSPTGEHFAISYSDSVELWDSEQHKRLRSFPIGDHPGGFLPFIEGGRTLLRTVANRITALDVATFRESNVLPTQFDAEIRHIAAGRDGQLVALAVGDKVKFIDLARPRFLGELSGHTGQVLTVDVSKDGTTIASIGDDRTIRLWDASGGQQRLLLRGHTEIASGLSLSPDARLLVTAGLDGRVIVWDTHAPEMLYVRLHEWQMPGRVYRVHFAPDGRHVATVNENGTSYLLRLPAWIINATQKQTAGDSAPLITNAVPDPAKLAPTGTPDWAARPGALVPEPAKLPDVRWWSIETKGHRGIVRSVAYSPDGKWLATAGDDCAIRLWNAETNALERILLGHGDVIHKIDWSPDSHFLASASEDRSIRIWEIPSGNTVRLVADHENGVVGLAWSRSGDLIATRDWFGQVIVWHAKTMSRIAALQVSHASDTHTTALAWSLGDNELLACGAYARVSIWNCTTGNVDLLDVGQEVHSLVASPAERQFAVVAGHGSIFDLATKRCVRTVPRDDPEAHRGVFAPDGRLLVTGGHKGFVRVWDTESNRKLHELKLTELEQDSRDVLDMTVTPDGLKLAACGEDFQTEVFSFKGLKAERQKLASSQQNRIAAAAVSDDGRYVATRTQDGTTRIWDRKANTTLKLPVEQAMGVAWQSRQGEGNSILIVSTLSGLKFFSAPPSPDHREIAVGLPGRLFSTSADGKVLAVCFWGIQPIHPVAIANVESGEIRCKIPHEFEAMQIALSPNGEQLALAEGDRDQRFVQVFDTRTGRQLHRFDVGGRARSLAWTLDGKKLAVAGDAEMISICDREAGRLMAQLRLPQDSGRACVGLTTNERIRLSNSPRRPAMVTALAWMADRKTLISVSGDRKLRFWNTDSSEILRTLDSPRNAEFTAGGKELVSATPIGRTRLTDYVVGPEAGMIRRFDVATGRPGETIVPLRDGLWLTLTPDGHYRGPAGIEQEIVYVVESAAGQETLSPAEFAKRFGWKN